MLTIDLMTRINSALDAADEVFTRFEPGRIKHTIKQGGDPVTDADLELDSVLKESLLRQDEGWLSEETKDDLNRLEMDLTWIVDPLDGTREFTEGLPEFCASVAAVVGGNVIAGGVYNPATDIRVVGAEGQGVYLNGDPVTPLSPRSLAEMTVLASRSEVRRGEWHPVSESGISVVPMGSVAYKMARVAAGLDHATWTLVPKHEWDVAGGAGLLRAAGGTAVGLAGQPLTFNQPHPLFDGVIAVPPGFEEHVQSVLAFRLTR
ncbi:MAG: 3'(2'),5'-bisphosphate nucleotidase CysQ [Actinomycetota bacterium]|nr:3'(2'),5'-bisphosphate nucleotidase CysQ [Actinomycetota bacterium]